MRRAAAFCIPFSRQSWCWDKPIDKEPCNRSWEHKCPNKEYDYKSETTHIGRMIFNQDVYTCFYTNLKQQCHPGWQWLLLNWCRLCLFTEYRPMYKEATVFDTRQIFLSRFPQQFILINVSSEAGAVSLSIVAGFKMPPLLSLYCFLLSVSWYISRYMFEAEWCQITHTNIRIQ